MVGPCQHLSKQRVRIILIWAIVIDPKGTACKIPSDAGITSLQKVICCVAGKTLKEPVEIAGQHLKGRIYS